MQEPTVLENEQETTMCEIGWLAGLLDGEGTICLVPVKSKNNGRVTFSYHMKIQIYNNDEGIISGVTHIFDKLGLKYFIQQRVVKSPRTDELTGNINYSVEVTEMISAKVLLELVVKYLRGQKKHRAELCIRFLNLRLNRTDFHKHSQEEVNLINTYLKLVGSSTTVCLTSDNKLSVEETV